MSEYISEMATTACVQSHSLVKGNRTVDQRPIFLDSSFPDIKSLAVCTLTITRALPNSTSTAAHSLLRTVGKFETTER
jgi:hypothetical protein